MRIPPQMFGIACLALRGSSAEVLDKWKDITSVQLKQSGASSMIKHLDDALPNVSVDQVVADANHEMTIEGGRYKWPATKDDNEFDSESWVKDGDGAGRQSDGSYHAYGYKYILPRVRRYKSYGDPKNHDYTCSCLALDRTSNPASIVFREYYHAAQGDSSRVARFDLDSTTKLLKVNKDDVATASKVYLHGNHRVQGAITVNGRYFLSQSNRDDGSDIISFTPGGINAKEYRIFPPGAEDLTYNKEADTLWTLTEHAGERYEIDYEW
ncbi:MAG: hypothetical protein Q9222_001840 [Ikaeria aurantiellina]